MCNYFNCKLYKQDWYLVLIFFMMSVAIVVKSYFNVDGYLTPDSTNYLALAENLLSGKGYHDFFNVYNQDSDFFAIWPVGYPILIFIVSKVTGLSVFWASKVLNIFLVGVILWIFRSLFKNNAYVYGFILFFSSYIEIFSYTWSETLFITALLWFASSIYLFIHNSKKSLALCLSIILASLLMFMSRYVGAFSFGLIGMLGLYYGLIKKEKFISIMLIGIATLNMALMILYLYINYTETGFVTGMQRIGSLETNIELFYALIKAIFSEILIITYSNAITLKSIIIYILQMSILFFLFWKYQDSMFVSKKNRKISNLPLVFLTIGLFYLFFIILMRWVTEADIYGYRFFAPGSFLLFVSIIFFIEQRVNKDFFNLFKMVIFSFAMVSFLFNVPYKVWKESKVHPIYSETRAQLIEQFQDVEANSSVIFASEHIHYLYPSMKRKEPYSFPYSLEKETWSDFMKRIDSKNEKHIYIFVNKKKVSIKRFDQSVIDFLNKYDEGTLVKVK